MSREYPSVDFTVCRAQTCTACRTGKWVTTGSPRFTVGRLHTYLHNSAQRHAANSPYIRYHLARHTLAMSGQPGRRVIAIPSCATGWLPPICVELLAVSVDEGKARLATDSSMRHKWFDLSRYHRGSPDWNLRARVGGETSLSSLFPADMISNSLSSCTPLLCAAETIVSSLSTLPSLVFFFRRPKLVSITLSLSLFLPLSLSGYGNHVRSGYTNSCMIEFRKNHVHHVFS